MGGNGVYFFEKEDYKLFLKKEKIKSALRGAVTNEFEGFEVYYQPIIDCSSGNIIGAEALMRFSMYSGGKKEVSRLWNLYHYWKKPGLLFRLEDLY